MYNSERQIIHQNPPAPPRCFHLQNTGDIPGAKALYHRALSLQPNSPELLNNVGWLEEQSGGGSRLSLETAAELYGSALVLLPEESLALKQIEINLKNVRRRLLLMDA